jgi:MFS family permease
MVAADLYRLAFSAVIPLSLVLGFFQPVLLFGVVFMMGIGHTIGYPNLTALLGEVVPLEERPWVNGMLEMCMQFGLMAGAALCGLLYPMGGIGLIFLLDTATFLLSALLFLTMPAGEGGDAVPLEVSLAVDGSFAEGWNYLRSHPALMLYGVGALLPWVATMSFNTVLPGLVLTQLGGSSIEVGILDASYSVGGVLAGIAGALAMRYLGVPGSIYVILGLGLAGIAGLLEVSRLTSALVCTLAFGLGNSGFRVIHRTFVLLKVPNHVLGRILSLFAWGGLSASAIGMVLTGRFMDWFGVPSGVVILAVIQVTALTVMLGLGWKGFFRTPHSEPEAPGASKSSSLPQGL